MSACLSCTSWWFRQDTCLRPLQLIILWLPVSISSGDIVGPAGASEDLASGATEGSADQSGWAASMSHAADISSRLAQQVAENPTNTFPTLSSDQGANWSQSESPADSLGQVQQWLEDPEFSDQPKQMRGTANAERRHQISRESETSNGPERSPQPESGQGPESRSERQGLPKWLQGSEAPEEHASTLRPEPGEQLQAQLLQRLQGSGAEPDPNSQPQGLDHLREVQRSGYQEDPGVSENGIGHSNIPSQGVPGGDQAATNADGETTRRQAFSSMQVAPWHPCSTLQSTQLQFEQGNVQWHACSDDVFVRFILSGV